MALKGRLGELPLLDILQIVAFSKKTGNLHVRGPRGTGVVVFKDGHVVCAYSPSTIDFLHRIETSESAEQAEAALLQQIQMALRELMGLKEGAFRFEVTRELPSELFGIDLSLFHSHRGIDMQRVLLGLAKEMDEERREATALFESAFQHPPAPSLPEAAAETELVEPLPDPSPSAEATLAVVLVDDEPLVRRVVGGELEANGHSVETASSPAEGVSAVLKATASGKRVLLVTDLRMPTSTGRSFLGGFEAVRTLLLSGSRVPVVLMCEKLTPKIRARAKKLGVRRLVFKPALSKLDPLQYGADLKHLASRLSRELAALVGEGASSDQVSGPSRVEDRADGRLLDFLASMTERLVNPRHRTEVSRMVLYVASKYLERGILLLRRREVLSGLGGFGLADTRKDNMELAQRIRLSLDRVEPFAEVAHGGSGRRLKQEMDSLEDSLYSMIGRGQSRECVLIPLLNNGEVLAVLYGDNAVSGRPLGKLRGLELFIAQAGMALENLTLHRKLEMFEVTVSPKRNEAAAR